MNADKLWRLADGIANQTRALLANTPNPITCRGSGCNGCCRGEVAATAEEVVVIAKVLDRAQRKAVLDFDPGTDPRTARCPLLDERGLCGIYRFRPAVCRLYMAITPPEDCYPENGEAQVGTPMSEAHKALLAGPVLRGAPLIPMLRAVLLARYEASR